MEERRSSDELFKRASSVDEQRQREVMNEKCTGIQYSIAGKFGGELGLAVYISTAKLKMSYSHIYMYIW